MLTRMCVGELGCAWVLGGLKKKKGGRGGKGEVKELWCGVVCVCEGMCGKSVGKLEKVGGDWVMGQAVSDEEEQNNVDVIYSASSTFIVFVVFFSFKTLFLAPLPTLANQRPRTCGYLHSQHQYY